MYLLGTYFGNYQERYTSIEKINGYSIKFEFHYRDMSIWNRLQFSYFFHFCQNIMQNNEEVLQGTRLDSVQLHHLKKPNMKDVRDDKANSEKRNLSINVRRSNTKCVNICPWPMNLLQELFNINIWINTSMPFKL